MERLIKNNDIILDGTATRDEKEKEAFKKLGELENIMHHYGIVDLIELVNVLNAFNKSCQDLANLLGVISALQSFIEIKGLTKESKKYVATFLGQNKDELGKARN